MGRKIDKIPRKYMKVIKNTVAFCLKIEAKYVGSRIVIQQGAKSAAIPAKNEAINDALIKRSIANLVAGLAGLFGVVRFFVVMAAMTFHHKYMH